MGLFNFLAAGNSLKGLVRGRAHHVVDGDELIPNFGMRPDLAAQIRDARQARRREDPISRRTDVADRQLRDRSREHKGPRVRSTFQPEKLHAESKHEVASPEPAQPEVPEVSLEPPPNGRVWVRKLKMPRRVVRRPNGKAIKRQPKRPSSYRPSRTAPRQRRSPSWMAKN